MSAIRPFTIDVNNETLDWITHRVKTAKIPSDITHPEGHEWDDGMPSSVLEDLKNFWSTQYDWRQVEARLNSTFKMFKVELTEGDETIDLHFVHHRSPREDAVPLIFAHGWPGNFTEVKSLLSLTDPSDPKQQAFHIVAPTIPGFRPGFSIARIARVYHKLMVTLGYKHYVAQGGDWGSFILRSVAIQYPEAVVGLHINFPAAPIPSPLKNPITLFWLAIGWLTPEEKKRINRIKWFFEEESGYSKIQGTKPQTISHALLDSPIGMLAWIREKINAGVEPDYVWDKEEVITWTILYLLADSAGAARIYKAANAKTLAEEVLNPKISRQVAFGISSFPQEIAYMTRWWAEACVAENITYWKMHDKGGHFPAVEVPDRLLEDILGFVKSIPVERRSLLSGQ
ncbi:epoxide hydrolase domain-containing protein [Coprinopsis cinerea okayama7|uniref:Epoxide hydrolase domain-containing protein n=1 Tax=Coprinopsis cinerea (strain Okayama-7 / 130 / ATCC MYA-4618 / FGSC 9003) TaxID=240176 RepID=A8N5F2_COPC7|nr:epoxide hydrolase domain-containing protein [Coprinopsis cinerea okayama7\|eukprot:XP_001830097.2 epoxide hydrolase domain-containing protein [Coprinopsis cinerea okayama7\